MTTVSAHRPAALLAILLVTGPLPAPQPAAAVAGVPRLEQLYELGATLDVAAATLEVTADVTVTNQDGAPLDGLMRAAMGEETFFGALRSWLRRQRFAFVTEAELLGHLAARSDRDLRPIYDAFLADYAVSTPRPTATIRKARPPAGSP